MFTYEINILCDEPRCGAIECTIDYPESPDPWPLMQRVKTEGWTFPPDKDGKVMAYCPKHSKTQAEEKK